MLAEAATILVVDDQEGNRRLATAVLEEIGYRVLTADGGSQAVAMALAHPPHLVLMDIEMPGMDGVTALRALRADQRTATLKVIAVTGHASQEDADRLLDLGFDDYLSKPIRYRELMAKVAGLLAGGALA